MRETLERWLIDRATVYTVHPTSGMYSVVDTSDLQCRLAKIDVTNAGTAREELLAARRLIWDADYAMPNDAVIDVNGQRWNVVTGTMATYRRKLGDQVYRAADVVRAD
jgi:hypothetical protein